MTNRALVRISASAVLGLVCTTAHGAEWQEYFENRAGVRFAIDTSSIVRTSNGTVRAWERQQWAKEDPKLGRGYIWLVEVDCRERTYAFKDIAPIKGTAENLKQIPLMKELYAGPNYFAPNDLDEARYATFCAKNKK